MAHQNKKKIELQNGRIASNKKARHDYEIIQKFEAGIVLQGSEVKTLRLGRAQITEGYIHIDDKFEIWAENISIPPYHSAGSSKFLNHDDRRKRKLLLNKKEILTCKKSVETKGMTIVPLSLYFLHGKAKMEIAIARGKHLYDKRQSLKEKQQMREIAREVKVR